MNENRPPLSRLVGLASLLIGFFTLLGLEASAAQCVRVEVFIRKDSPQSRNAVEFLKRLRTRWPGLAVDVKDVADKSHLARAHQLIKHYKIKKPGVPIIYAARQLTVGFRDEQTTGKLIENMLTIHAYLREGCPRCGDGKRFLAKMHPTYPGFRIQWHDVNRDAGARDELLALARRHNIPAPSLPAFHFCGELMFGFISEQTSGKRIEDLLKQSCVPCPPAKNSDDPGLEFTPRWELQTVGAFHHAPFTDEDPPTSPPEEPPADFTLEELPLEELPTAEDGEPTVATPPTDDRPESINLPVFGALNSEKIGLPLFTLAVGLVDGFNPCAMWILLFLLSILVNLKDRRKILAVAGTFVLISGLAYFAFMAAWLNVFLFVGFFRPAQITLGLLAVFVGGVHIKDFFAKGRGVSLSIPESAKPGIYGRVRKIVTAEYLLGAVLGAAVLAVLVNVIELLCTAGLPALYTQILTMQNLPPWQNYAYLGLYNLAYMFDDSLMVAVVVITMGRRKMQERQGRWLKLVSGFVIVALGMVLLFQPEWLV